MTLLLSKMYKYRLLLLIGLCIYPVSASAQSQVLDNSQIGITYSLIDSWRTTKNLYQISSQKSINAVESLGLFYSYKTKKAFILQLNYSVDRVQHRDLNRTFFNSSYHLSIGHFFDITELSQLTPKLGFSVINHVDYYTIIAEVVGRPETRSITHYYSGKEPFRNWSVGFDYRHRFLPKLYVGLSLDLTYNFVFNHGRTYLSPYLAFDLK